jgi:hypothetical protein
MERVAVAAEQDVIRRGEPLRRARAVVVPGHVVGGFARRGPEVVLRPVDVEKIVRIERPVAGQTGRRPGRAGRDQGIVWIACKALGNDGIRLCGNAEGNQHRNHGMHGIFD